MPELILTNNILHQVKDSDLTVLVKRATIFNTVTVYSYLPGMIGSYMLGKPQILGAGWLNAYYSDSIMVKDKEL